jgi:hypothetical protein
LTKNQIPTVQGSRKDQIQTFKAIIALWGDKRRDGRKVALVSEEQKRKFPAVGLLSSLSVALILYFMSVPPIYFYKMVKYYSASPSLTTAEWEVPRWLRIYRAPYQWMQHNSVFSKPLWSYDEWWGEHIVPLMLRAPTRGNDPFSAPSHT